MKLFKAVDLSKFSEDTDRVERVRAVIQTVANHILSGLRGDYDA